jgi:uncharacterized protein (DUF305 family)
MPRRAIGGAIIAALVSMPAAACGSHPDTQPAGHGDQSVTAADRNHADVEFASGMISHHGQAVDMARLAPDRAESPRVKDLARRIEAAQEPEIQQMRGWLTSWGRQDSGHGHEAGAEPMPGMLSAEQMAELKQVSDSAFDRRFLHLMIEHHEGAIAASRQQLAAGANAAAKALAEQIIRTQQAEIDEMRGLLGDS